MDKNCQKCKGACCKFFFVPVSDKMEQSLWVKYHEGVEFVKHHDHNLLLVKSKCKHLDELGLCHIYSGRPNECRKFKVGGHLCEQAKDYMIKRSD